MNLFSDNIYFLWFLIGVALLIGELMLPTFILAFFSIGAFLVSIILYFYVELSFNNQILIFTSISLLSLFFLRSYLQKVFLGEERLDEDKYFDNERFKDSSKHSFGVVVEDIPEKGFGEIKYKGSFYKAKSLSESVLLKDENVKVLRTLDGDNSIYVIDKI